MPILVDGKMYSSRFEYWYRFGIWPEKAVRVDRQGEEVKEEEQYKGKISVDGEVYQSVDHYWVVHRRWLKDDEYTRLEEGPLSGRVESRG